ncbi:MAG TPA: hypothetical protein VGE01_13450, partial [Fimbriimonas sp.]
MNAQIRQWNRRREGGQTIVVALIILGLLLILAFVFLAVINQNIQSTQRQQQRTVANDLAEAGIRYAHAQLLNSELGADWRGQVTTLVPVAGNPNVTADPDALYLRPGSVNLAWPDNPQHRDLGGPDGLGPYFRVPYAGGRALVRVRYAPTDANILAASPLAALRTGAERDYTIIEAIGREGAVNLSDPTKVPSSGAVQYQGFTNTQQLEQALAQMRTNDQQNPGSRRLRAFASIGIIESAWYIHNKDKVSRPAEIGIPDDLGAMLGSDSIGGALPRQYGGAQRLFGQPGQGSFHSNADILLNGIVQFHLNRNLGERVTVAASIKADDDARLELISTQFNGSLWNSTTNTVAGAALDSRNPAFDTFGGVLLDGVADSDASGRARNVAYKTPPSILTKDPDTGELRYRVMSRESGVAARATVNGQVVVTNSGQYGHGRNVYVNNFDDRQVGFDEASRANAGGDESLVYDWLNPGNTMPRSGWKGGFYIPRGATLNFRYDGFEIIRDGRGPDSERVWLTPAGRLPATGADPRIVYRIGIPAGGSQPYIVNSLTPGVNINAENPDFSLGMPFGGVLFFEG